MTTIKKLCPYGERCYRKNPAHFQEYSHSSSEPIDELSSNEAQVKESKFQPETISDKQPNSKKGIDSYFVKQSKTSKVSGAHKSDAESSASHASPQNASNQTPNNGNSGAPDVSTSKQGQKRCLPKNDFETEASTAPLEHPSLKRSRTESPASSVQDFFALKTRKSDVDLSGDYRTDVERFYGAKMPEDFYLFWDWCKSLTAKNPLHALRPIGIELVGPFELLAGLHRDTSLPDSYWLCHWRYFFDPPEFTTVLRGNDATLLHFGYFRDDPNELPVFVGFNEAKKNCRIEKKGENLFAALKWYLDEETRRAASSAKGHSKTAAAAGSVSDADRQRIGRALDACAAQHQLSLAPQTDAMRARQKRVVCSLLHGGGLVVPVVKNVGYRPVPSSEAELKKTLRAICEAPAASRDKLMDPLCELVNLCQFANDECDYGESIELGLNLFSFGPAPSDTREAENPLHAIILQLLPLGYELVRRPLYAKIVREHLAHRGFGVEQLSELSH